MVHNPANTIAITAGDLVTLSNAGVPGPVITRDLGPYPGTWTGARVPTPARRCPPLVDLVRMIKSGISESIIASR